jgi:protein FrlC
MKLGFRTAGYRDWPLLRAFGSIAEAGYDGVEVCLEHREARPEELSPRGAAQIAQMAADAGLEVASVSYHADDEPDAPRARNQRRAVMLARDFSCDLLILNSRKAVRGREAHQWQDFRRDLDALLPLAQAEGVFVCLEPEPGHFLHSCADMARLLHEVGSANLKVNLDVGHAFLTDADLPGAIGSLKGSLAHAHIEGMAAGVHKHLLPGEGDLDLRQVREALREAGFDGYWTVDLFDIADDPQAHALASLQALRRLFDH